jgi:hypothetical protein
MKTSCKGNKKEGLSALFPVVVFYGNLAAKEKFLQNSFGLFL